MSRYLAHIAELVINQPLMIMPEKLAVIASVLEGRINIDASDLASPDQKRTVFAPMGSRYVGEFAPVDPNNPRAGVKPYRTTKEGTAIIPVHGSLVNRGGFLDAMSGITSYEKIKYQVRAAAADRDVRSIILDVDSGGGEAIGAFEAGDAVRMATFSKRVHAVANGLCCSAAYAIASGASRIITSRSSVVGSIGTALLHLDRSKQLSDAGIKPTLFVTGKRKGDGSPFFELSEEVKGELRSYILRVNQNFLDLVAGHRGVTAEALLALEAGVFIGAEAIARGLVDEVGTFEDVVLEQARMYPVRHAPAPKTLAQQTQTIEPPKAQRWIRPLSNR
ncbi:MAG: S49 family peptidase [Beijerinckiaceae bacterium]|nr:S49 family peptidase [Beijerinckiaceae bacterium]